MCWWCFSSTVRSLWVVSNSNMSKAFFAPLPTEWETNKPFTAQVFIPLICSAASLCHLFAPSLVCRRKMHDHQVLQRVAAPFIPPPRGSCWFSSYPPSPLLPHSLPFNSSYSAISLLPVLCICYFSHLLLHLPPSLLLFSLFLHWPLVPLHFSPACLKHQLKSSSTLAANPLSKSFLHPSLL